MDNDELEFLRREHMAEMGYVTDSERAWSDFYDQCEAMIISLNWDNTFTDGQSCGLDGDESVDGYSVDGAGDAFARGSSVDQYIQQVRERRTALGLSV